jgi:hypothetical protein
VIDSWLRRLKLSPWRGNRLCAQAVSKQCTGRAGGGYFQKIAAIHGRLMLSADKMGDLSFGLDRHAADYPPRQDGRYYTGQAVLGTLRKNTRAMELRKLAML